MHDRIPFLGEIVHYHPESDDGTCRLNGAKVNPAIITAVHDENCVNLRVFSDGDPIVRKTSVTKRTENELRSWTYADENCVIPVVPSNTATGRTEDEAPKEEEVVAEASEETPEQTKPMDAVEATAETQPEPTIEPVETADEGATATAKTPAPTSEEESPESDQGTAEAPAGDAGTQPSATDEAPAETPVPEEAPTEEPVPEAPAATEEPPATPEAPPEVPENEPQPPTVPGV